MPTACLMTFTVQLAGSPDGAVIAQSAQHLHERVAARVPVWMEGAVSIAADDTR